jgi:ASPIC and UnbV/FG-GAP-like repeat
VADWVDARGVAFFRTGEAIARQLDSLNRAIVARDPSRLTSMYAADFQGRALGLDRVSRVGEKDGIERSRFDGSATTVGRDAAADEWSRYLASFTSVLEAHARLERIEQWGGAQPTSAILSIDVLGTLVSGLSVTDRLRLRATFTSGTPPLLTSTAFIGGERLVSTEPQFRDVAANAGVAFVNRYYPPFLSEPLQFGMIRYGPGGITAVDYDNDGYYDLFIPDGVEARLFRNTHDGRFVDVTAAAGLAGLDGVSVGVFADYDNDGHKDLFVSRTFRPNQLFHNNGDGTFTDVTKQAGIGADCCTTVASWADYDGDGFLDLYVGRYLDPRKTIPTTFYARNGEPNQLYHNNGDGTFTNVTARAGVGDTGLCLGSVWGDYDDDGFPDLYVVNDFGRSTLFHNNGNGTFTDVTVATNTLAYGAGMSASFVDYDNDGRFDFYTTDILSDSAWFAEPPTVHRYILNSLRQGVWMTDMPLYFEMFWQSGFAFTDIFRKMASGNTLLRNTGHGRFDDVTAAANANPPGWFWGASFADFDNDGWQDVYIADGWVRNDPDTDIELEFLNNVVSNQREYKNGTFFDPKYFGRRSWHGWERNRHLLNNGDGTFREIGHAAGTDLMTNSRGVAVADFWNRGRLDIAVAASGGRHALLKNEIPQSRHWLDVELTGTRSNRDAVGARVSVRTGSLVQSREVVLGDGYGSQNTLRQHFGLADTTRVDEVRVRWPASGLVQVFHGVAVDGIVAIVEGRDTLERRR